MRTTKKKCSILSLIVLGLFLVLHTTCEEVKAKGKLLKKDEETKPAKEESKDSKEDITANEPSSQDEEWDILSDPSQSTPKENKVEGEEKNNTVEKTPQTEIAKTKKKSGKKKSKNYSFLI
jgi:hypothetical protein